MAISIINKLQLIMLSRENLYNLVVITLESTIIH
jgi:hypothetical protein